MFKITMPYFLKNIILHMVDWYMIELMKNFGIGIELALEFVNRDSSDVDLRDPYFSNLTE